MCPTGNGSTLYSCAVLLIWCFGVMPSFDTAYAMMEQTPMWHIVSSTGNLRTRGGH